LEGGKWLQALNIERIAIGAVGNGIDDPGFFVTVHLKDDPGELPTSVFRKTASTAVKALESLDDERFLFLTFLYPEPTANERPAA